MAMFIVKPWYRKKDDAIYGAEWAGGSDPSWVRTDAAVGFSNPNPYYSGMSTTPSSPFDNIMPWSGMRRVTDASAGELVEIPKFYYKWTRDGVKMKLQISMKKFDGFLTSPAHADRGDGVGERDYVYVGRYHCASDYKSVAGYAPKTTESIVSFRNNIHNLGSNVWIFDFATLWTIRLLYLVEFANWNCQAMIGFEPNSRVFTMGTTDNMPYHTGTTANSRTSFGNIQYRHIENLWGNCFIWVDGIYARNYQAYTIINPSLFSATQGGDNVGPIPTPYTYAGRVIKGYNSPLNYPYAMLPIADASSSDYTTYICDVSEHSVDGSGNYILFTGSDNGSYTNHGLFFHNMGQIESSANAGIGSRLMVLPPSRLSA